VWQGRSGRVLALGPIAISGILPRIMDAQDDLSSLRFGIWNFAKPQSPEDRWLLAGPDFAPPSCDHRHGAWGNAKS
jgi:hypothetical protein